MGAPGLGPRDVGGHQRKLLHVQVCVRGDRLGLARGGEGGRAPGEHNANQARFQVRRLGQELARDFAGDGRAAWQELCATR